MHTQSSLCSPADIQLLHSGSPQDPLQEQNPVSISFQCAFAVLSSAFWHVEMQQEAFSHPPRSPMPLWVGMNSPQINDSVCTPVGGFAPCPRQPRAAESCRDEAEHKVKLMCVAERGFVPLFSLLLLSLSFSAHIKQSSHFKSSLDLLILRQRQMGGRKDGHLL